MTIGSSALLSIPTTKVKRNVSDVKTAPVEALVDDLSLPEMITVGFMHGETLNNQKGESKGRIMQRATSSGPKSKVNSVPNRYVPTGCRFYFLVVRCFNSLPLNNVLCVVIYLFITGKRENLFRLDLFQSR